LARFVSRHDQSAFETLLERHGPMVLSVCRRVAGDVHAAEDAFQATFLVLARRAASIRNHASLASWLFGVARRIAAKARTQAATRRAHERRAGDMPNSAPLDELSWRELRDVLDEEIDRLADKYRAPVLLCYLEGKSHEQAAQELGWHKSSLTSRLAKARELLRSQLTRRGIALSAAALATALTEKATAAPVGALSSIKCVKAAACIAAGKTVAEGILSAHALALAEEAMKSMIGIKSTLLLMVLTLGVAVGAAFAGYEAWQRDPPGEQPPPVVQGEPKKDAPVPGRDLHDDLLPAGAVARMGQDRWLHSQNARFAAFLPDGKTVVTVNMEEEAIRVWEYPSGKEIRRIPLPPIPVSGPLTGRGWITTHAALTRDGKTIAVGHIQDRQTYLYDLAAGTQLKVLPVSVGSGMAFSPDGSRLVVSTGINLKESDKEVSHLQIWDWDRSVKVGSFVPSASRFC
jgi:RNA polymerase sigma factor (sigma-70 family)